MSYNRFSPCQPCCNCTTYVCANGHGIDDNPVTSAVKFVNSPTCSEPYWYYTHGPQTFPFGLYTASGYFIGAGTTNANRCDPTGVTPVSLASCVQIPDYEFLKDDGTFAARRTFYMLPGACYNPLNGAIASTQGRLRAIISDDKGKPIPVASGLYFDVYQVGTPNVLWSQNHVPARGEILLEGMTPNIDYKAYVSGIGYKTESVSFNSSYRDVRLIFKVTNSGPAAFYPRVYYTPGVAPASGLDFVESIKCQTVTASLTGVYDCTKDIVPSGYSYQDTNAQNPNCFGCKFIRRFADWQPVAGTTVFNDVLHATDPWGTLEFSNGGGSGVTWGGSHTVDIGGVIGCPLNECSRTFSTINYTMSCGTDNDGNVIFTLGTSIPVGDLTEYYDSYDENETQCTCTGSSGTINLYPMDSPHDGVCGIARYWQTTGGLKCANDYGAHNYGGLVVPPPECPQDYPIAGGFANPAAQNCPSGNCNISTLNGNIDNWTCRTGVNGSTLIGGGFGVVIRLVSTSMMNDNDTSSQVQDPDNCVCDRCDDTSEEPACNGERKSWYTFRRVGMTAHAGPFNCSSSELNPGMLVFHFEGSAPDNIPPFDVTVSN